MEHRDLLAARECGLAGSGRSSAVRQFVTKVGTLPKNRPRDPTDDVEPAGQLALGLA
jgi:hypothetical protein